MFDSKGLISELLFPKISRKTVKKNQAHFGRTMVETVFQIYASVLYEIPKEGEEYDDVPFEEIISNIIQLDKKSLNCFGNMEKELIQIFGVELAKILAPQAVIYQNKKDKTRELVFKLKPKSLVEDLHVEFIFRSGNLFVPFSLKATECADRKHLYLYYGQKETSSNSSNFPKEPSLLETRVKESKVGQDANIEGKETIDANSKMNLCLEFVLSNVEAFSQQIKSHYANKVELLISNLQGATVQAPFTQKLNHTISTANNSTKDKIPVVQLIAQKDDFINDLRKESIN
jgi:hypothetical protein